MCTDSELQALEAGLVALLNLLGSGAVVARLLTAQPGLLAAPLESWLTFFEEYGFSDSQTKNLVAQCPEVGAVCASRPIGLAHVLAWCAVAGQHTATVGIIMAPIMHDDGCSMPCTCTLAMPLLKHMM